MTVYDCAIIQADKKDKRQGLTLTLFAMEKR